MGFGMGGGTSSVLEWAGGVLTGTTAVFVGFAETVCARGIWPYTVTARAVVTALASRAKEQSSILQGKKRKESVLYEQIYQRKRGERPGWSVEKRRVSNGQ